MADPLVTHRAAPDWETVQAGPEFARLRHAVRSWVFPVTVAFLAWYLLYVVCAAYARGFMNVKVFGNVTIGLIFGLLQFVSTFLIAIAYSRRANRRVDPLADQLRDEIEDGAR
ncbi:DUF485 domain-containing protein [Nakamurella endophytica]|uniref:Clumping factor B n=1 Tax=Nakamurella endophytica TaxID=1748367 RepID=A0A917SSE2_9ACTN|nr:DUF485 domain-containing protein [Nakamurella endophytica]GGL95253.1 clumping factor B [Nakamurella endophytica]